MNKSPRICDESRLLGLLENSLTETEQLEIEEHVGDCKKCQELLDNAAASPASWNEAKRLLTSSEVEKLAHSIMGGGDLSYFRNMLGPSDDPRMLGRVGTYEILGLLGRGGMGVVFKAYDSTLDRYVAIKMLAPVFAGSPIGKQRFLREAQSAAAVVHEHVVPIHAISTWQDSPYIVMTYVRGDSLQKRIASRGMLSLRELLRIGMQTASGLAAAHAQGLIHRDIKPGNILLETEVERVQITDFGLARAVDDIRLTRTDGLAGSPAYMSPEQVRDERLDFRTDLFSLGIVLYEAATGRSPFRAATSYGATRKITDHHPPEIQRFNSDLPDWFGKIVMRLLEKEPTRRYSSAAEVSGLLQTCLAHVEQPHLTSLPSAIIDRTEFQTSKPGPFINLRRFGMTGTLVLATFAAGWLGLVQLGLIGQVASESQQGSGQAKGLVQNGGNSTKGVVTKVGNYELRVAKVADVSDLKMSNEFDLSRITTQSTGQSFGGPNAGGFVGGGGGGATGKFFKPNTAIALEVKFATKEESNIVEVSQKIKGFDDKGRSYDQTGMGPSKVHFVEFESLVPDSQVVYLYLPDHEASMLSKLEGELLITPGRILLAEFDGTKKESKKVNGISFSLDAVKQSKDGIQVTVVFPPTTKLKNARNPMESMQATMAAQMGAYSVTIVDSSGDVHYSTGGGSNGGGGGSTTTFSTTGSGGSFQRTQGSFESTPGQNYNFAPLVDGRKIKKIQLKMIDRTGDLKVIPFTMENVLLK